MKLKSFFKKFFLGGELIAKYNSPINGDIFVFEDLFGRWVRIGGVSQSGGLVVTIWDRAIREILRYKDIKISSALILGLGCGNAAKLATEKWPEAKIVGVEIDPIVVEVGRKYFGLDRIKNLKLRIKDAIDFICRPKAVDCRQKYDLILVDLYLGKQFPKEAESREFLEGIKKLLTDRSVVIFNRFYWGEYKKQADNFKNKLEEIFPNVWDKKTVSNKLFFASNLGSIEV